MKYIDHAVIKGDTDNTAAELASVLNRFTFLRLPVEVTDEAGDVVNRLSLYEKTLSDGSKELVVVVGFDKG